MPMENTDSENWVHRNQLAYFFKSSMSMLNELFMILS